MLLEMGKGNPQINFAYKDFTEVLTQFYKYFILVKIFFPSDKCFILFD